MKENTFKNVLITYGLLTALGFVQMYWNGSLSSDGIILAGQIMGRPTVPLISSLISARLIKGLSERKQLVVMFVVGTLSMFLLPSALVLALVLLLGFIDILLGVFRKKEEPSQQ